MVEALVDLGKALIDLSEPLVYLGEPLIDVVEAPVHMAPEVELLVGPALPHRLHDATLADKKLRRIKECAQICNEFPPD
jgi:hypothetical protein